LPRRRRRPACKRICKRTVVHEGRARNAVGAPAPPGKPGTLPYPFRALRGQERKRAQP
jgi:hypothetical protein